MRILVLTHRLPFAPNRGDRIRAYHLLRLLAASHEVHLVSLVHDAEERHHLPEMQSLVASVRAAPVNRWRSLVGAVAALPTSRPLTHVMLDSPMMPRLLADCVAATKPEVVLAYCTGMARYAFERPLSQLPCVLDMVDVDSQKWADLVASTPRPLKWVYGREARLLRRFERHAAERVHATVVVSERERQLAERRLGTRPLVVGNGVDVRGFGRDRTAAAHLNVLFCGVFNYGPNEEGAIWLARDVWPEVKRAVPSAVLQLVGMHPSRRVQALAAPGSVEVTGAVPDVRPYLWQGAVSVAPLAVARGVQNKVLEGVAAGLPCVVTPAVYEGLPESVRAATLPCGDAAAFANAIVTLLEGTAEARASIARRANLGAHSWETQLRPFLEILEDARATARFQPCRPL